MKDDVLVQFDNALKRMQSEGYVVCGFFSKTDGAPSSYSTVQWPIAVPLVTTWAECIRANTEAAVKQMYDT